jgi:hypothetical protein
MSTVLLEKTNLISVAEAARILKVTTGRVRQLIDAGIILGEHLSERAIVVDSRSVREYAKSPRKPGPKRVG